MQSKTRIKKKEGKIKEVEATVNHAGKITYSDDLGEEKEFIIDDYSDFHTALGMCQTEGILGMEVSIKFFDILANSHGLGRGKDTAFIVWGTPPVKVFRLGTMEKQLKILNLSIDKMNELRAKKGREVAAAKKKAEDEITDL